jgi:hypothetical protein
MPIGEKGHHQELNRLLLAHDHTGDVFNNLPA